MQPADYAICQEKHESEPLEGNVIRGVSIGSAAGSKESGTLQEQIWLAKLAGSKKRPNLLKLNLVPTKYCSEYCSG
jgi:hypothetical protein